MGTYTTNYNLFMPTVGEQGWGDLVNGNFTTIDVTMGDLNTRLTAVEDEVNGNLNCTSVTTSGTIVSTGKITANGGLAGGAISGTTGMFDGIVTATKFTPTSTTTINVTSGTPTTNGMAYSNNYYSLLFVLPDIPNTQYTGSVILKNTANAESKVYYNTKWGDNLTSKVLGGLGTITISFTNVPHVYIFTNASVKLGNITFS